MKFTELSLLKRTYLSHTRSTSQSDRILPESLVQRAKPQQERARGEQSQLENADAELYSRTASDEVRQGTQHVEEQDGEIH